MSSAPARAQNGRTAPLRTLLLLKAVKSMEAKINLLEKETQTLKAEAQVQDRVNESLKEGTQL